MKHLLILSILFLSTAHATQHKPAETTPSMPKANQPEAVKPKATMPKANQPEAVEPKTTLPKADQPQADKTKMPKSGEPKAGKSEGDAAKTNEPKTAEPKANKPQAAMGTADRAASKEAIFAPGILCRAVEGKQLNQIDAVKSNPHGIISRGDTSGRKQAVRVTCPILKVNTGTITSIQAYLNHPQKTETKCSVSRSEVDTGKNIVRTATFRGAGDLLGQFGDFNETKANDTYVLTCLLAENTVLRGYSWMTK